MKKNNHTYQERAAYNWSTDSVRLIVTPSTTAKSLYFYIQEAGYFKTSDSYFTERQNLNSFLIVYTISGNGLLKYHGESYELTTGSCFFINCMDYHYYETAAKGSWEFVWVHFNGNNALGYYQEFTKDGFQVIDCQHNEPVQHTLHQIVSINKKRNISTEIISSNLITNLLTELSLQTITPNAETLFIPDYLKNILKEIERDFTSSLTLDSLSKNHGVSKFYLSREFKKYIGTTVNEYIIITRITYAKELLKYSALSVNEIAFSVGINNVSHFINLFKSREGTTPFAYRKEWRL